MYKTDIGASIGLHVFNSAEFATPKTLSKITPAG